MNLNDQRIVIIGGTSGIGLATAQMLAEAGASVVIAGRQRERLNQALTTLEGSVTAKSSTRPHMKMFITFSSALACLTISS